MTRARQRRWRAWIKLTFGIMGKAIGSKTPGTLKPEAVGTADHMGEGARAIKADDSSSWTSNVGSSIVTKFMFFTLCTRSYLGLCIEVRLSHIAKEKPSSCRTKSCFFICRSYADRCRCTAAGTLCNVLPFLEALYWDYFSPPPWLYHMNRIAM